MAAETARRSYDDSIQDAISDLRRREEKQVMGKLGGELIQPEMPDPFKRPF